MSRAVQNRSPSQLAELRRKVRPTIKGTITVRNGFVFTGGSAKGLLSSMTVGLFSTALTAISLFPSPAASQSSSAQADPRPLPQVNVTAPSRNARVARSRSRGQPASRATRRAVTRPPAAALPSPSGALAEGYGAQQASVGTKTDARMIEVPQSMSVVTRRQIEEQGAQSVAEALRYTAGVLSNGGSGAQRYDRNDNIYIRGFDATSVGLFRDGLRSSTIQAWNKVEPYGLDRIEVLQGPASVLYGQGSPGGMVNLISKRPTATPFNEVEARFGSFNQKQIQFDTSGPIDKEAQFLYRLTGLWRDSGTQFKGVPDDARFIAPSFTWRPNADTSLTVSADYTAWNFGPPAMNIPIIGSLLPKALGPIPANQNLKGGNVDNYRKAATVSYQFDTRINDALKFHSAARYGYEDLFSQFYSPGALATGAATTTRTPYEFNIKGQTLATDNHLAAEWSAGRLDLTSLAGVDYRNTREDYYSDNGVASAATFNVYNPVYPVAFGPLTTRNSSTLQSSQQVGVYGQQQIKIDRRWVVLGSIRHDWSNTETINRRAGGTSNNDDSATTGRIGLAYVSDVGVTPYVSYSTNFNPAIGVTQAGVPFVPTTGRQYEAGVKYQPVGGQSYLTVAAFDLRQDNVLVTDPTNSAFRVQVGQLSSRGLEGQAVVNLMPGLNIIGAFTLMDLETTRTSTIGAVGTRPAGLPDTVASLWADYKVLSGAFAGFGIAGGVRHVGETNAYAISAANVVTTTYTVPSYTLFDAAISYDFGLHNPQLKGLRFAVNVTNIADKKYWDSCTAAACSAGYGRRVVGSMRYRW